MPFLHRNDTALSFTSRVTLSVVEPFADQLDRITNLEQLNRNPAVQAVIDAERNAKLFKEVLHLICWIHSTEHLLPLGFFQIHDVVVAHNGLLNCPNNSETHLNSFGYITDLHTIKVYSLAIDTRKWVVVKESACSHSDPWRTMNCFVLELRKKLRERSGLGVEPMQLPNTRRYRGSRGARRSRRMASASTSGRNIDRSNAGFANQDVASTNGPGVNRPNLSSVDQTAAQDAVSESADGSNPEPFDPFRAELTHRKDSVQPTYSFGDEKTKKDLAQIWR